MLVVYLYVVLLVSLKAQQPTCPDNSTQVGPHNADIGGCGLDHCNNRYGYATIEDCRDYCIWNLVNCISFTWAPVGGDPANLAANVCTFYSSSSYNQILSNDTNNQVMCNITKPEPSGTNVCPANTTQVGTANSNNFISFCPMQHCNDRHAYATVEDCRDACIENVRDCVAFTWAPMGGHYGRIEQNVCTFYSSQTPTSSYGPDQVFCTVTKPEPSGNNVCPENSTQIGTANSNNHINGCGITHCNDRYGLTVEECRDRCRSNYRDCVAFTFALRQGYYGLHFLNTTVCTFHSSQTPTDWYGPDQVFCTVTKPEPSGNNVCPENSTQIGTANSNNHIAGCGITHCNDRYGLTVEECRDSCRRYYRDCNAFTFALRQAYYGLDFLNTTVCTFHSSQTPTDWYGPDQVFCTITKPAPSGSNMCPENSTQIGTANTNNHIPGCGITHCNDRYGLTAEECRDWCIRNHRDCVAFTFAFRLGYYGLDFLNSTICTRYSSQTPTDWYGPDQVFCTITKPSPSGDLNCPSGTVQVGTANTDNFISFCGMNHCNLRFGYSSPEDCRDACTGIYAPLGCVAFAFAPVNGHYGIWDQTVCIHYNSITPIDWYGPNQIFCVISDAHCDYNSTNFTVNWNELLTSDSANSMLNPYLNSSRASAPGSTIEIQVTARAKYVVDAEYLDNNVGVTYVLDTEQFEDSGRLLGDSLDTNACENRQSGDFYGIPFFDFWTYTLNPSNTDEFPGSSGEYLEYPNSEWNLTLTNDEPCTSVTWQRTFTFDELRTDCGFMWDDSNSDRITLTGTFYLTLVSPNYLTYNLNASTDAGQYITKQLASHEVTLSFIRASTIVAAANIELYGAYIISIDFDRNQNTGSNQFEVTIMTYVPNYLQISSSSVIPVPTDVTYLYSSVEDTSYSPQECMVNDEYRCWQKFILSATVNCASNSSNIELDNTFDIISDIECYNSTHSTQSGTACNDFIGGTYGNDVTGIDIGQVMMAYTESCDSAVYSVTFDGTLVFYDVDTGLEIVSPQYSNGDTAYLRVTMNSPIDSYSVLGVEIDSVTVCTADVDDGTTINTCLGQDTSLIYTDSDLEISYNLISTDTTDITEEFSITVPLVADDRFFVEVKALLTLNNQRRRRVLLQSGDFNRFGSAFTSANLVESATSTKGNNNDSHDMSMTVIIGICAGGLVVVILVAVLAAFGVKYSKMKKVTNEDDALEIIQVKSNTAVSDTTEQTGEEN